MTTGVVLKTLGDLRTLMEQVDRTGARDGLPLVWLVREKGGMAPANRASPAIEVDHNAFRVTLEVPSFTRTINFKLGVDTLRCQPNDLIVVKVPNSMDPYEVAKQFEDLVELGVKAMVVNEGFEVSRLNADELEMLGWVRQEDEDEALPELPPPWISVERPLLDDEDDLDEGRGR